MLQVCRWKTNLHPRDQLIIQRHVNNRESTTTVRLQSRTNGIYVVMFNDNRRYECHRWIHPDVLICYALISNGKGNMVGDGDNTTNAVTSHLCFCFILVIVDCCLFERDSTIQLDVE